MSNHVTSGNQNKRATRGKNGKKKLQSFRALFKTVITYQCFIFCDSLFDNKKTPWKPFRLQLLESKMETNEEKETYPEVGLMHTFSFYIGMILWISHIRKDSLTLCYVARRHNVR